ncbi:MAG TPA: amino acid adenylation domain-containing protein, partial [Archangium sp.]|nr:amino acid adenylation domain-containing protein [Archangium sp.]
PLDARQLPAARVAQLLAESRAPFVLPLGGSQALLAQALALLPEAQRPRVLSLEALEHQSPEPLPRRASPRHLSYVLFTSGSTGTPKAVMVEHRSLLNHGLSMVLDLELQPGARVAQTAAMSFDISVWQMIGPLLHGGSTYVFDDEVARDPQRLLAGFAEAGITLFAVVPAFLQLLVEQLADPATPSLPALRTVLVGGQALPSSLYRAWSERAPHVRVMHAYGPAECTDTVAGFRVDSAPESTFAPIGTPKANQEVWVLDEALQPVPPGVVGELYLGGSGVSRGYLHRPDWTAERFVPHPFSQEPGARLYRSGDLGRLRPDGLLEFVDRADFQVKVRGMRIELHEVEAALQALPQVRQAAATVQEERPGDKVLVAWVVPATPGLSASDFHQALGRVLPAFMVPSRFMLLEALPLNANGKVDRKALQALPLEGSQQEQAGEPPRGPEEERLAQLFRDVLGVEKVYREDDFFRLGGHSLSATRLVARARQAFGVDLPLSSFFAAPSVAGLATSLATAPRKGPEWKPTGARPARLPASLVQERLWYALQLPEAPPFVVVNVLMLEGALDAAKLEAALEAVVERNETLRTTFYQEGTSLCVRVNARPSPVLSRT